MIRKVLFILMFLFPMNVFCDECRMKWWKRERSHNVNLYTGHNMAVYTGQVEPGSASIVFVEVWRKGKLVAASSGEANPRGIFSINVSAEKPIKNSSRTIFSCSSNDDVERSRVLPR